MIIKFYNGENAKGLKPYDRIICPICRRSFKMAKPMLRHYSIHLARGERPLNKLKLIVKPRNSKSIFIKLIQWFQKNILNR